MNFYGGAGAVGPQGAAAQFLAYAFVLSPAAPGDMRPFPQMFTVGRVQVLSHLRYRYAADLTYQYEISPDLVTWSAGVNGIHFYEFKTNLPNSLQQIDLVILLDWPKVFLRPRATLNP
jgi:hypothetical protein